MNTPWIRAKDIPDFYSLSRWKGYELTRLFRAVADKNDFIEDGKIVLIRKSAFEDWWRSKRGRKND